METDDTKLSKYSRLDEPDFRVTDLHTHLLGMGSHKFWINKIMFSEIQQRVQRCTAHTKGMSIDVQKSVMLSPEFVEWYGPRFPKQ